MTNLILMLFSLIFVVSCNKPDPEPEKKDPIYADLQAELQNTQKQIADVSTTLKDQESELEKVTPQTGKIKYAQKRVFGTQKQIDLLKQQEKYWTIRIDERARFIRRKSMDAFKEGKTYDAGPEYQEYLVEKRLRRAKLNWDARQRREDVLAELKKEAAGKGAEGGGEGGGEKKE